jgi:single-strand selective monofunctional uracil DNA glycosylase
MGTTNTAEDLVQIARSLSRAVSALSFGPPVSHVYNPLQYARQPHELYLRRYGNGRKRVLFLGMNPGPFGMAQTGIPFGEVQAVREFLGITGTVGKPRTEHLRRKVTGFGCLRSEVSGRRLWGLFAQRFGSAKAFFQEHFVLNYCPLLFVETTGRNLTPDKLPKHEKEPLLKACDQHLMRAVDTLGPEWVIGVGEFAANRAREVIPAGRAKVGVILHPSPANPKANKDWPGIVSGQLLKLAVWT